MNINDKNTQYRNFIEICPIYLSLIVYIIFSLKNFLSFLKIAKNENKLNICSKSNFCLGSLYAMHFIFIISLVIFTYSFYKCVDINEYGSENNCIFIF